jgi:hypothetical protein
MLYGPVLLGKYLVPALNDALLTRSRGPDLPPISTVESGVVPSKIRTVPSVCILAVQRQLGDVNSVSHTSGSVICDFLPLHSGKSGIGLVV